MPEERLLRAELRQEAASEGRMAMRARLAGSDPGHYELDQRYYELSSEGVPARYPQRAHDLLDVEQEGRLPRLASWPVGTRRDWRDGWQLWLEERGVALEQRRAEQVFVDSLTATAQSLVWDRPTTPDADRHAQTHVVLDAEDREPYVALSRGRSAGRSM